MFLRLSQKWSRDQKKIAPGETAVELFLLVLYVLSIDVFQAISKKGQETKKKLAPGETAVELFLLVLYFLSLVFQAFSKKVKRPKKNCHQEKQL